MNYYHSPVYIKLSEYLFYCRKKSVNVNIALVMLKKIREFPAIYIEEIALLANTTPASVTRFCKVLGYSRFQALKQDLLPFFSPSPDLSVSSADPAAREIDMLQKIHQHMPVALCQEVALALRNSRNLLILSTDYSFTPSNLFREALSNDHRRVYQLHRQSESSLLAKFITVCDTLILIDLTGKWLRQHPELITALSEKISVCFTANTSPALSAVFSFVIDLTTTPDFFSSNYFSCQVITSTVFRIISDVEQLS